MTTLRVGVPDAYTDSISDRALLAGRLADRLPEGLTVVDVQPATGGFVVTVSDTEPQRLVTVPVSPETWTSRDGASRLDTLLRQRGLTLHTWDPATGTALAMRAGGADDTLRGLAASLLGVAREPWRVQIALRFAPGRLETVTLTRDIMLAASQAGVGLVDLLPAQGGRWAVAEDVLSRRLIFTWEERPELPPTVPLADLLPGAPDPAGWATLPLGVDAAGTVRGIDLRLGPHALIVGPTGSGKTISLVTLVASALVRGHDLVLIDPTKSGLDFSALRPWATAWATTLTEARVAMERVYAEVQRRKAVLQAHQEVLWADLPLAVRERENIRPMTVLIDEFGSLALEATVPKGLPKDHPLAVEAVAANADRAIVKELVGRVAREARFVGIHLEIALQRPDVAIMGSGELRSNLTSVVQLVRPGAAPSRDALAMALPAEVIDAARDAIAAFDDGVSRGLAVMAAEGGSARAIRVAYAPMAQVAGLLRSRGVPTPPRAWSLEDRQADADPDVLGVEAIDEPEPLASVEISLDDLDAFTPAAPAAPLPEGVEPW